MRLSNELLLGNALKKALGRKEGDLSRPTCTRSARDLKQLLESGTCKVITMSARPWDASGDQRDMFIVDLIDVSELENSTAMIL